jgi:hypothetical protein
MMAQRAHQGVAAARPPSAATTSPPLFLLKQNKQFDENTKYRISRIMRRVVLASLESARKANRPRLDDRAAIYRALNGSEKAAGNRRRYANKLLGAWEAKPRLRRSIGDSATEAARR